MSATRFIKEVIVSSGTAKVVVDDIFSVTLRSIT